MLTHAPLIWSGESLSDNNTRSLGGKAANLVELQSSGHRVPPFYVITIEAYRLALDSAALGERIARRVNELDTDSNGELRTAAAEIRTWIRATNLPPELAGMIADHEWTRQRLWLAVRSSVADEDAGGHSFAGLHSSVLPVRGSDRLEEAIKTVWASAYSEPALIYRQRQGLSLQDIDVAVIVQQMIRPRSSGVMFTVNPATQNADELVISSVFGAGEGLVSAGFDADRFVVDKDSLAATVDIAEKTEQFRFDANCDESLHRVPLPEPLRAQSSLSPDSVESVARAGLAIELHFGRPQDVEFVIDPDSQLFILQSRPVTTVTEYGRAAGNRLIWDNSNIIESYFGVTSPMTFSFIRRAYTIVYYCFAEVMGISPDVVRRNKHTFENMLGLFRGRVYYNLLNWFRLLRLFPGFDYNRQFMQSMMGLKEPVDLQEKHAPPGLLRRYFVELPALIRLIARSSWNFFRIRGTVRRFNEHFENCYRQWHAIDFNSKAPHELMALYRSMEDTLLWDWKAPIINDFYVMVFCGVLRKLCKVWCGDQSGSLANDLLCGEGDIVSAAPTKMLLRLARMAAEIPDLKQLIVSEPAELLAGKITSDARFSAFTAIFQQYLELYGARRMNELKLEEYSLRHDPGVIFRILRNYLTVEDAANLDLDAVRKRERQIRVDAESRARRALRRSRSSVNKSAIFQWVLENARFGTKNREEMRFARTRVYDILRDLIHAIAEHLVREKILRQRDDIFYLTLDEVWDFIKGTAVTTNLNELVVLRRKEFDQFREDADAAPDSRFETYGLAYHRNRFKNDVATTTDALADGLLQGTPCSSGTATGRVRVATTPEVDTANVREILVTERTDPGWVPLYPTVSGILIERGSILSHSAIVAREMGIPTIVGIPGLVNRLRTGDHVAMDGSTGRVEVLSRSAQ